MELIKKIEDLIEDEICDVKKYAKLAVEMKETHPALARVFYDISTQEDTHQQMLHSEVVKIIEQHKRTHGDPPAAMMALYEYIHKRHIDKLAHARHYQEMYKNG